MSSCSPVAGSRLAAFYPFSHPAASVVPRRPRDRCLPMPTTVSPAPAPAFSLPSVFHLAFNVGDLGGARAFYGGVLGCREGRSTDTWVDYDFFGHQLSLHLGPPFATARTGRVGDKLVP